PSSLSLLYTLSLHDALPIFSLIGQSSFIFCIFRDVSFFQASPISYMIVKEFDIFYRFFGVIVIKVMMQYISFFQTRFFFVKVFEDRKSTRLNSSHVSISYAV